MNQELWSTFQEGLNQCYGCRDKRFAKPTSPIPSRPFRMPSQNCVLFIGEAPPKNGGFWKPDNDDAVRRLLFPCLKLSRLDAIDSNSVQAINTFVDEGFFFVQAIKWPLIKSYNKLSPVTSRAAIEHSFLTHLEAEINMINPRGIIALGNGAWHACRLFSSRQENHHLDRNGIEKIRCKHHNVSVMTHQIPLHVTYLPGSAH